MSDNILRALAQALVRTAQEVRNSDSGMHWTVRPPVEFICNLLSRHLLEQVNPKAIEKPLNGSAVDEGGWVDGIVSIGLVEVIENDMEGFLDLLSTRLVGNEMLMGIGYELVGMDTGTDALLIKVTGHAENCFRSDDEKELPDSYICNNCRHMDNHDKLPDAKDLWQRLTLGGIYTDKECPECGALCFPSKPERALKT